MASVAKLGSAMPRVMETCTISGASSDITLNGAVSGYFGFAVSCANTDPVTYTVFNGNVFETWRGLFRTGPNRLTRVTLVWSSASPHNSAQSWASGTATVMAVPNYSDGLFIDYSDHTIKANDGTYSFAGLLTGNTSVTFPTSGTLATTTNLANYALLSGATFTGVTSVSNTSSSSAFRVIGGDYGTGLATFYMSGGGYGQALYIQSRGGALVVGDAGVTPIYLQPSGGAVYCNGNTIWHAGNDGSGSGCDADTLDGYHASSFAQLAGNQVFTGNIAISTTGATPSKQLSVTGEILMTPPGGAYGAYFNVSDNTGSNGSSYSLTLRGLASSGTAEANLSYINMKASSVQINGTPLCYGAGTTGSAASATGYIIINVNGTNYKVLHCGTA